MREFFRGGRRKMGCVMLVMACMFMDGWVRSLLVEDTIENGWHSRNGAIECRTWRLTSLPAAWPSSISVGIEEHVERSVPYWSLVLPLTVLSACLLLSKPRVAKPRDATKPTDAAKVIHA